MGKNRERGDLRRGLRRRAAHEGGFTLVEILVTLTIIGILVAIAVPSYLGYQQKATKTTAEANLRAVLPAVEAYYNDHGTYVSMTDIELASSYDQGISPGVSVLSASDDTYCVTSTHGSTSFFKHGPGSNVTTVACA